MTLEQQVCTIELAKKLKELGAKRESVFYYNGLKDNQIWSPELAGVEDHISDEVMTQMQVSAFTVAELGEMLPWSLYNGTQKAVALDYGCIPDMQFWLKYRNPMKPENNFPVEEIFAHGEADARAKMLIYLLENKLV